jgi:hypothetical protein
MLRKFFSHSFLFFNDRVDFSLNLLDFPRIIVHLNFSGKLIRIHSEKVQILTPALLVILKRSNSFSHKSFNILN